MAFRVGQGVIDLQLGTRGLSRGMAAIGPALRSLAGVAGIAGVGMATVKVMRTFASFEQSMARVKALTGATGDQLAALERQALKLGETTIYTASQAAGAMSYFAQAGFTTNEILKAMPSTLDLAAAGQLDLAAAADIVAKIMRGMGHDADELQHDVDVLTKAFISSNTNLIQLGEAMKFVGPIGKTLGKGIEEITAAIQTLSNAGIQATMAGTTMRNVFMRLARPSREAAKLIDKYGISALDSSGRMRHLADIIDDFNRALGSLGEGQKLAVLSQIFEMRAASGFAQLMAEGGDALRQFERNLVGAGGTAKRVADIQMETLKGSMIRLKSAAEGLQIAIGAGLAPAINDLADALAGAIPGMSAFIRQMTLLGRVRGEILAARGLGAIAKGGMAVEAGTFLFGGAMKVGAPPGLKQLGETVMAGAQRRAKEWAGTFDLATDELNRIEAELAETLAALEIKPGGLGKKPPKARPKPFAPTLGGIFGWLGRGRGAISDASIARFYQGLAAQPAVPGFQPTITGPEAVWKNIQLAALTEEQTDLDRQQLNMMVQAKAQYDEMISWLRAIAGLSRASSTQFKGVFDKIRESVITAD